MQFSSIPGIAIAIASAIGRPHPSPLGHENKKYVDSKV